MRRTAPTPRARLTRPLLCFALCFLLFAAPLTSSTDGAAQVQRKAQTGRGKRVQAEPARSGAPEASLPNLDDSTARTFSAADPSPLLFAIPDART